MSATPSPAADDAERTTAIWVARLSPRDCVHVVREMAVTVQQWHQQDLLHRAIHFESLQWPRESEHPQLSEPSPDSIEFGGPFADPDLCPPELRSSRTIQLPCSLQQAQRVLTEHGALMLPDRIDVYQLGTLLCRLVSGKSIRAYLSSPATMSRVPKLIRNVIDRCIGYDESNRVENLTALIDLLTATQEERGLSNDAPATTQKDTDVVASTQTRVARRVPPFQQLGHFDVLEEIGHGGMGVVYRGFDRSLDRTVALKVLHPRFASDPSFVKRFKAEATAAGKLNHPHLVPIYFIGEDSGRHFFAMQFIDGESLAERLHRVGKLSREEVLAIMQQVLLGLAAAHRQGFVHRDIKPGNILLDREIGSALLTDFGLACGPITDEPADPNLVMGTAEYMSPEQAQGNRIDARSDLYSVGVVLYQLLSGQTPFDANTPSSQMIHHVCEQPQPLSKVAPQIEPPLVRIVERLLKKRPDDRYQSVEEVLIDLQQLPGQQPLVLPGQPLTRTLTTVESKNRWTIGRIASFSIVPLLLLAAWFMKPANDVRGTALTRHADAVLAMTFSRDGKTLVTGGGHSTSLKDAGDTCLRLWDAESGQMLKQSERLPIGPERLVLLEPTRRVLSIASAREGTGTAVVWDPQTGRQEAPAFDEPFAFHFDAVLVDRSTVLAVGNRGLVELHWSEDSGSMKQRLLRPTQTPLRTIAVAVDTNPPQIFASTPSSDGECIVQFAGRDYREQARWIATEGPIVALAVSGDGTMLVARTTSIKGDVGDLVVAMRVGQREPLWTVRTKGAGSRGLSMSRDGRRVIAIAEPVAFRQRVEASESNESSANTSNPAQAAVVLDGETGREICRLKTGSTQLQSVAISPDGKQAALGDNEGRVVFSRLP